MNRRSHPEKPAGIIILFSMTLFHIAGCGDDEVPLSPECRRPRINAETTKIPGGTTAVLKVEIDPGGHQTTYRCEYGVSESFGKSTVAEGAGSGNEPAEVYVRIHSLETFTRYYFRWRASNECGETVGRTDTFTTVLHDPPLTYLAQQPSIDTVGTTIRVHLYWSGMDLDGQVAAYQWQRTDEGVSSGWHTTTGVDSIFELEEEFTEDWLFHVRAMDNDGLVDPVPPVYVFHARDSLGQDLSLDTDLTQSADARLKINTNAPLRPVKTAGFHER